MFQFGQGKPALGILFDSDFGRTIDSVLALALLHGLEGKREARIASLSINNPSLKAAQLCDVIEKFYASATTGLAAQFFQGLPIGLAAAQSQVGPAVSPVASVLEKYPSRINTINDTAEPATLLRNVLTAQYDQNAVVVLTGSATNLLSLLALRGASDLVAQKVKYLVAACTENSGRLFTDWPTPIVTIEPQAMSNIKFPATSIETDFAYNPKHPVADAYRAYQPMPYDAPTLDMAAVLYAGRPKGGYFQLSGSGKQRQSLTPDPAQADKIIAAFTQLASAKPVPRAFRRPPVDENAVDEKEKPVSKQN